MRPTVNMILQIFSVISVVFSITYGQKPILGHPPAAAPSPAPLGASAVHPAPPQTPGMQQSPPHPEPNANTGTPAKNESHPCTNANISECFHLIAVQMNKTEELLKMANQTLNTANNANKSAGVPPPAPSNTAAGVVVPVATNTGNTVPVSARVSGKTREKREVQNP